MAGRYLIGKISSFAAVIGQKGASNNSSDHTFTMTLKEAREKFDASTLLPNDDLCIFRLVEIKRKTKP